MWLLHPLTYDKLAGFHRKGVIPTAEQNAQLEARFGSDTGENRLYASSGERAVINIEGVLTKSPDFFSMFFGGGNVTWGEITDAIARAEADSNVISIDINIDSGGGEIAGMFEAIQALANTTKPTRTIFKNMGGSAAYAFGVQADEVLAFNKATRVGSVGVVVNMPTSDDVVTVTSTEAPNKRPDVTTEEGKDVVRAQLDDIHNLFVGAIAEARNTTSETVNANFGRGGVFLAEKAVEVGMIDGVLGATADKSKPQPNKPTAKAANPTGVRAMDLETLKAEHPGLVAAIAKEATTAERNRCQAHLIAARTNDALEIAEEAIKAGTSYTDDLVRAKYDEAGAKSKSKKDSNADDAEVAAKLGAGKESAGEEKNEVEEAVLEGVLGAFGEVEE